MTARFVEAIAPLMSGRFRQVLRGRVYDYFDEERGHEVMERASCEALGVDRRQLDEYLPMPYFATFIDVYTLIADTDPLAFLTSVMVSEGLPGDPYGINGLLGDPESYGEGFAEQFRTHEGVNDDVDHALLARALFSDVPSVTRGAPPAGVRGAGVLDGAHRAGVGAAHGGAPRRGDLDLPASPLRAALARPRACPRP